MALESRASVTDLTSSNICRNFPDFEQRAQQILASQGQPLSHCQNTTQSTPLTTIPNTQNATSISAPTTSSPGGSHTVPPPAPTSGASAGGKVNISAAVGGSLGGALGLVVLGAIIAILRYRRRSRGTTEVPKIDSQNLSQDKVESMPESVVTPFFGKFQAISSSDHLPGGTPSPRTYGEEILHPPGSYTVPTISGYGEEDGPPVPLASPASSWPGSQLREYDTGVAL
ncbi:hypothetical protein FOMPIDRAFT_1046587 [Fomitopsis schrenkii]|uniref:Uncharacterized protein n=1 Tax=Fomitopsis schrenkii TaxID=2126942 RepID=S8FSD6_FOMSC|nr:hypothetical protein FOMPIDRAFT_1046587 [Fomitopsis schrenkii]